MGKYISGIAKQGNIDKWANYAKRNSYDGAECRRQSGHDLDSKTAPKDTFGNDDAPIPEVRTEEGKGWYHPSYCSKENSYTGKGGSKRP